MHSIRGRGRWLYLLFPMWSVCFGLTLRDVLTPTPFPPALVRFDAQHGPVVLGPRNARTPLAPLLNATSDWSPPALEIGLPDCTS